MLNAHSLRPHPEKCFAPNGGSCEVSAQHTPRQNLLLAALPVADYARLLPHLEPVCLPLGWTVHSAGDREKHLYFLTAGVVSRYYATESGASAEFAVTGREGVIGVATFLGGSSTPSNATVLSAGHAYRLGASQVRREVERGGPLVDLLLRYTQALIAQMIQTAACNRHHPIERQLCRSILSILDRSPSNELTMTHERMADMLGVRREGITEAAGKLQEAGLMHYGRGHITVLDRARLEAQACECYSAVKREYERLLPNCGESESFPCEALAALEP
jgi:CRP-like cAMP-binding protein